tara:strand:- start:2247 stop:2858 length:612 start_codon:yes stop_codon:yes gene_type:complete
MELIMPSYESPLGKKSFGSSSMKEYDVPDESNSDLQSRFQSDFQEELSEQEQKELREARKAKLSGKERLNDGAKRRIEMLIGMSRVSRSCELDGNSYLFQSLKSKDMRDVYTASAEFDGTIHFAYEIRRQTIARSLSQVGGVDINQFLGSNTFESRLMFLDELPESLLQRLFIEYRELEKESNEKYAIKTEGDAKEVVEDLKK